MRRRRRWRQPKTRASPSRPRTAQAGHCARTASIGGGSAIQDEPPSGRRPRTLSHKSAMEIPCPGPSNPRAITTSPRAMSSARTRKNWPRRRPSNIPILKAAFPGGSFLSEERIIHFTPRPFFQPTRRELSFHSPLIRIVFRLRSFPSRRGCNRACPRIICPVRRPLNRAAVCGEVAERSKAHAWKVCIRESVSRVRIPFSPPLTC